ncbi:hypothetical protein LINGRAHAP2_LOCUS24672 [Linum grandiflorum]
MLDIPWKRRREHHIDSIAEHYFPGKISTAKLSLNPAGWTREVKVFVNVTVADPLIPSFILDMSEEGLPDQKVKFRYEDLQEVCIYCGRIGHEIDNCNDRADDITQGGSGEPTGEFRNLKVKLETALPSPDDSDETWDESPINLRSPWKEGSGSSDRSFSTPSLNSPINPYLTLRTGGSTSRSGPLGKEPLQSGPTFNSPTFHHFFPPAPNRNKKSSPPKTNQPSQLL